MMLRKGRAFSMLSTAAILEVRKIITILR